MINLPNNHLNRIFNNMKKRKSLTILNYQRPVNRTIKRKSTILKIAIVNSKISLIMKRKCNSNYLKMLEANIHISVATQN